MEQRKIEISVIMGVYNPLDRDILEKAVASVIGQTFENWELILCDDGSDIAYQSVIGEAARMDERIIRIRNSSNYGLGYSLNQCLSIAQGKYIARMDGDDISLPDRFQKEYDFLENHPEYQWVGSNSELFDGQGVWGIDRVPEQPEAKDFYAYSPYIHPTIMFRKNIPRKVNGYPVSEETRRCEDYELFMRLHKEGYHGYNLQEPLLQYREDNNTYKRRTMQSRIREMKIRYKGFRQLGILGPEAVPYIIRPLAAGTVSPAIIQFARKNYRAISKEQQV